MIVYLRVVPGIGIAMEEIRRPEIRLRPVVVGGSPHGRGVVQEANIFAQDSGIRPGMTLAQAHQQCPDALFLPPDFPHNSAVWEAICDILRAYTPLVESIEMGQAIGDLSGSERQWIDPRREGQALLLRIQRSTGITPWLGIASNRLLAQCASMAVDDSGITVVEAGKERAFLSDLPLSLLPEVDSRLALTFQALGLHTIGQFAALPATAVRQRFGVLGERLHRYARGIDSRPVTPPPTPPSIHARYECDDGSPEEAIAALRVLAETCTDEMRQRSMDGRLIGLTLTWRSSSVSLPLKRPMNTEDTPLLSPPSTSLSPQLPSPDGGQLPIPYRIHSMLPQPGALPKSSAVQQAVSPSSALPQTVAPLPEPSRGAPGAQTARTAVRTPIVSAHTLVDLAQRLFIQMWRQAVPYTEQTTPLLEVIDLEITEFAAPTQLAFIEFNLLGQTGALNGLNAERLTRLEQQEQVLAARHGTAPFRHLAKVDPANILTERRFQWHIGLPRQAGASRSSSRGRR